jgi:hypothetical protein
MPNPALSPLWFQLLSATHRISSAYDSTIMEKTNFQNLKYSFLETFCGHELN